MKTYAWNGRLTAFTVTHAQAVREQINMITPPDYDDPAVERKWCLERQAQVAEYLRHEGVKHGRIGDWPAWHVAPHVSIWAIESAKRPGWIGWWAICGDLPTDYIPVDTIKHPREAMHAISQRWLEVSALMKQGQAHPTIRLGTGENQKELAPLLESRARTLAEWASDDSLWEEDKAP